MDRIAESCSVSLTECGVALILLENELANNSSAIRRWSRRLLEAETELQELKKQRDSLNATLHKVKETI